MTMALILTPNIADPDGVYDELLQAHDGLTKIESDDLNAQLILMLPDHVGDRNVLRQALAEAK